MCHHSRQLPPGGTALSTPELPVLADAAYDAIVAAIARAIATITEAHPVALSAAEDEYPDQFAERPVSRAKYAQCLLPEWLPGPRSKMASEGGSAKAVVCDCNAQFWARHLGAFAGQLTI